MYNGVTNEKLRRERWREAAAGAVCGLLNGLFGSGGGVVAVMFLRSIIGDETRAHATATLTMLLMSSVSLALYAAYGLVDWGSGLMFVPGGFAGALIGGSLLKKIKSQKLRKLFGGVLCASGVVMLLS